eukprot:3817929-Amphidinium_carterae.3
MVFAEAPGYSMEMVYKDLDQVVPHDFQLPLPKPNHATFDLWMDPVLHAHVPKRLDCPVCQAADPAVRHVKGATEPQPGVLHCDVCGPFEDQPTAAAFGACVLRPTSSPILTSDLWKIDGDYLIVEHKTARRKTYEIDTSQFSEVTLSGEMVTLVHMGDKEFEQRCPDFRLQSYISVPKSGDNFKSKVRNGSWSWPSVSSTKIGSLFYYPIVFHLSTRLKKSDKRAARVTPAIVDFINRVPHLRQLRGFEGLHTRRVMTDWVSEFENTSLKIALTNLGVSLTHSPQYQPKSNGTSECMVAIGWYLRVWDQKTHVGSKQADPYAKVELGLCSQTCQCTSATLNSGSGIHWSCVWRNSGNMVKSIKGRNSSHDA